MTAPEAVPAKTDIVALIGSVGICGRAIFFIVWISLFTQVIAR